MQRMEVCPGFYFSQKAKKPDERKLWILERFLITANVWEWNKGNNLKILPALHGTNLELV